MGGRETDTLTTARQVKETPHPPLRASRRSSPHILLQRRIFLQYFFTVVEMDLKTPLSPIISLPQNLPFSLPSRL